jgi:hypothetical protein
MSQAIATSLSVPVPWRPPATKGSDPVQNPPSLAWYALIHDYSQRIQDPLGDHCTEHYEPLIRSDKVLFLPQPVILPTNNHEPVKLSILFLAVLSKSRIDLKVYIYISPASSTIYHYHHYRIISVLLLRRQGNNTRTLFLKRPIRPHTSISATAESG